MSKELLTKLKRKKQRIQQAKAGSDHPRGRDRAEKARIHLDLHLLRNKKGFYMYMSSKRKTSENVGLLLNGARDLLRKDVEKSKVLSAFFAAVFVDKNCPSGLSGP